MPITLLTVSETVVQKSVENLWIALKTTANDRGDWLSEWNFFKKPYSWSIKMISWASRLGIIMAYNRMSNPLTNISWKKNSSHCFAQTVNCWDTGLKFQLKNKENENVCFRVWI